jgi:hypothetical protein
MHRQRGEIRIVAGKHDLLHRRFRARQLDDRRGGTQPPLHFGEQPVLRHAEGSRLAHFRQILQDALD